VADVADCFPFRDSESTAWINIDGLQDLYLSSISNKMNEMIVSATTGMIVFFRRRNYL